MERGRVNSGQADAIEKKTREWKSHLVAGIAGLFLFLSASGALVYLAPFSIINQFMVLFHTALGLVFVVPFTYYQFRHYLYSRRFNLTTAKLLGYCSFITLAVCVISGLVVTWQPIFDTRLDYTWDLIHTVSGLVSIPMVLSHIVVLAFKYVRRRSLSAGAQELRRAMRRFATATATFFVASVIMVVMASYAYIPVTFHNELPQDYSWKYGDKPFRPSLAETSTGGAFDPRSLAESATCGKGGCHRQILEEWLPSAHRYASMDIAFQAIQNTMATSNGSESTRYCAGCHDPIALFSGSKNIYDEDLSSYGADEGVSCIVCHSITTTDVKGNADYVITQPDRYIFELEEGAAAGFLSDFLIRAYPRHHVTTFTRDLYKTPEFCGACHKQFIDKEINKVGWVQLQNQYDNWKSSRWHQECNPQQSITCRECHMQLYVSTDPAAGDHVDYNRSDDDGNHRSHRFLGANQFIPKLHDLPNAEQHVELTEQWIRGEIAVPEIADKWTEGPVIPVEISAPNDVRSGDTVGVTITMLNNKAGHDFPTGPLDMIQAWVDVLVQDQHGNVVFRSGGVDDRHFIQEGSFIFKAEGIDQYGNLIDRHNLWDMIGARFKRALFPGFSDMAEYQFFCPAVLRPPNEMTNSEFDFRFTVPYEYAGGLHITAKLMYRKINQFLVNFLFGEEANLTAPITEVASDTVTVWVKSRREDDRVVSGTR